MERDYDRALAAANQALQLAPHYPLGHRGQANALAQLGRLDEAYEALNSLLRLSPKLSVAGARRGLPFREETDFEHYVDGLRKAGLPEE